jgi:DNA-binding beta-propeller fold protein YncE
MSAKEHCLIRRRIVQVGLCLLVVLPAAFAAVGAAPQSPLVPPPLLLEGGRRLEFVRAFSSEQDVKTKHPLWNKLLDVIAGAPNRVRMVRPYDVVTDSRGRIIVSDPGAALIHIFDFDHGKYEKLVGGPNNSFKSPIGVAVDNNDNIYVADSELGMVLVFDSHGKFRRYIGNLKGEGFFKRPTGIAVDAPNNRVYVTDTLHDAVYYADLQGNILGHFGSRGSGQGEFNYPTELVLQNRELFVVDAMNFRVQFLDEKGRYLGSFGQVGPETGHLWRTKGLAMDNEGHFYVADAMLNVVQVFDREGTLLYYFGQQGEQLGEFNFPSGVFVDRHDRVYVVDMLNHRVEVFQYFDKAKAGSN